MPKQNKFKADFGANTNTIFIYDYGKKYIVELKSGQVKKIYGKDNKVAVADINGYKNIIKDTTQIDNLRSATTEMTPEEKIMFVFDMVRSLFRKGERRTLEIHELISACLLHGVSEDDVKKAVRELAYRNEIFLIDNNTISSIHLFK
ncbi:MAG: hypothetical protein QXK37_04185 [Candidatus Woesearchaeota archaeon]